MFFSRITLESQLGSAYEPYIFAALNSAKVMVVVGTKPEYFNAVWVKNEWSRYLAMIRKGEKKQLIPAYRDMDPYDMPEEFSYLQSQDMSKLGFMQDLIRGIRKIVGEKKEEAPASASVPASAVGASVPNLLKRVSIFLWDQNYRDANSYCEKVLDLDPENAEAYLGKLLCDLRLPSREDLAKCDVDFSGNGNYQKAYRYGDADLRTFLSQSRDASQEACEEKQRRSEREAEIASCKKVMENAFRTRAQIADSLNRQRADIDREKETVAKVLQKAKKARGAAFVGLISFVVTYFSTLFVVNSSGESPYPFFGVLMLASWIAGIYSVCRMMANRLARWYTFGEYLLYSFLTLFYAIPALVFSIKTLKETSAKKLAPLSAELSNKELSAANYVRQLNEVSELIRQKEARIRELTER